MKWRRALKWLGIVVGVLAVLAGAVYWTAFGHNSPIVEGPVVPGVETVKDGFVNVFILDAGPGRVALVDAGNDKSGAAVLAALSKRNLTPASVAAIFLTHWHTDHTAGCRLFPGAEVYVLQDDASQVGDGCKVTHPWKDGDVAAVGDLRVEEFATPGHTLGSGTYLARGVLFFGDSAGASRDGDVMKAVSLFSNDSAMNVASLKALAARLAPRRDEIKALAFGHTGTLVGLDPLLAFAARP